MALLGRNGAGKSTTFKMIAGSSRRHAAARLRSQGRGWLVGRPGRIARARDRLRSENRQVFPDHTVDDNLIVAAKKGPRGDHHWNRERIYEVFPILASMKDRLAGRLSGGEQ